MRRRATVGLSQALAQSNPAKEFFGFLGLAGSVGVGLYLVNEPMTTFLYKRRVMLQDGISTQPDGKTNSHSLSVPPTPASSSASATSTTPATPATLPLTLIDQKVPSPISTPPPNTPTLLETLHVPFATEVPPGNGIAEGFVDIIQSEFTAAEFPVASNKTESNKTDTAKQVTKETDNDPAKDVVVESVPTFTDEPGATGSINISEETSNTPTIPIIQIQPISPPSIPQKRDETSQSPGTTVPASIEQKRRIYNWGSFTSHPALEMHQSHKNAHYGDGDDASGASRSKEKDDLSSILRERKKAREQERINVHVKETR